MASQPKEVAADVYWLEVGQWLGRLGKSNVYFVRSGSSWVLIDAGWQHSGKQIARAAAALFGMNSRPAAILLTHIHPDHSGAVRELAQRWGAPVYAHANEMPLASGALLPQYANPLDRWLVGPLLRVMSARARERMRSRASLEGIVRPMDPAAGVPGLPEWEVIPTPGHTPGHVSFFRRYDGVLVTGDACLTINVKSLLNALLGKQRISGPPYISSWNWRAAKASVATLARLDPDTLAPGHGAPMTATTPAHELRAFSERFMGAAGAPTSASLATRASLRPLHEIERRFMAIGVRLYRMTDGKIARTFGARGEVLLLTTRGRKSGKQRTVILQGFRDGADLIVVAANNGQPFNPGWYYNLKATPSAHVELGRRVLQVRAEELSAEEAAAFWPRVVRLAPTYAIARRRTSRVIPLMRLIPVEMAEWQAEPSGAARQIEPASI